MLAITLSKYPVTRWSTVEVPGRKPLGSAGTAESNPMGGRSLVAAAHLTSERIKFRPSVLDQLLNNVRWHRHVQAAVG